MLKLKIMLTKNVDFTATVHVVCPSVLPYLAVHYGGCTCACVTQIG